MLERLLIGILVCLICAGISQAQSGAWEEGGNGIEWSFESNNPDPYHNPSPSPDPYPYPNPSPNPYPNPTPNPNPTPDGGEGVYYTSQISEGAGTLIDESASGQYPQAQIVYSIIPGGSQNAFWIVSRDGTQNWQSISMPFNRYARLLLIPATSGQLTIEEVYPNGQPRDFNFGWVRQGVPLRMWFYSDARGTHRDRYSISNGPWSDTLTFNVY